MDLTRVISASRKHPYSLSLLTGLPSGFDMHFRSEYEGTKEIAQGGVLTWNVQGPGFNP